MTNNYHNTNSSPLTIIPDTALERSLVDLWNGHSQGIVPGNSWIQIDVKQHFYCITCLAQLHNTQATRCIRSKLIHLPLVVPIVSLIRHSSQLNREDSVIPHNHTLQTAVRRAEWLGSWINEFMVLCLLWGFIPICIQRPVSTLPNSGVFAAM